MVEVKRHEEKPGNFIIRGPVVISGLFGDENFHKYRILSDIWRPFGVKGLVIGGKNFATFCDFEARINETIELANDNGYKLLIGNSVGATLLLISYYKYRQQKKEGLGHDEDDKKIILIGFDPDPNLRMRNFPEKQIDIWANLGIPKEVARTFLGSWQYDSNYLRKVIEWALEQPNIYFFHGDRDETIPLDEILKLGIDSSRLIIIPGGEHNSAKGIERVIEFVYRSIGIQFVPLRSLRDLLSLDDITYNGLLPYLSKERVGFAVSTLPEGIFEPYINEHFFYGDKRKIPQEYLVILEGEGNFVFGINLENLQRGGFKFYPPIVPPRSVYPHVRWVQFSKDVEKRISNESLVYTTEDKSRREEIELYKRSILDLLGDGRDDDFNIILSFIDEESNLWNHFFEVYKTLRLFGINEQKALVLSFFHDLGKGIYIRYSQIREAKKYLEGQEQLNEEDLRRIGYYRNFINESDLFRSHIEEDSRKVFSLLRKLGINPENSDFTDRQISLMILFKTPFLGRVLQDYNAYEDLIGYYQNDNKSLDVQLLRLADLVSPYLFLLTEKPDLELIGKAVTLRLEAINKLYGANKRPEEYLTQEVLNWLSREEIN
jgi:hypothetical protein